VCNAIFTSIEAAELPQSLLVSQEAQNTGNAPLVTSFRRDKLYVSIYNSCRHRPDAITDATALTDTILGQLSAHIVNASITSAQLRTLVHTALRHFDTAAATHYAAFHPEPPKAP
jgi:transcriptional regulator NrdR family protein